MCKAWETGSAPDDLKGGIIVPFMRVDEPELIALSHGTKWLQPHISTIDCINTL